MWVSSSSNFKALFLATLRTRHRRQLLHSFGSANVAVVSTFNLFPCLYRQSRWRYRSDGKKSDSSDHQYSNGRRQQIPRPIVVGGGALMAFSFKQFFGWDRRYKLDDHPIKDKIKHAILYRRYGKFDQAIEELNAALKEAFDSGNDMHVSRVYDELANTYYEANDLEKADTVFRLLIDRMIRLHRANVQSPEFIGISLKLADILARQGRLEEAEIGYKHCVAKQMDAMERHLSDYHVSKGAMIEANVPVDEFGTEYTDPIALFGICLQDYAHFLVEHYANTRLDEAQEYINEVLKISHQIYGVNAFHSLNILNMFAASCINKTKFEAARKYLEIGIKRVVLNSECEPILVSFYCNYAEALFHTGDPEQAVDYAKRALVLAESGQSQDPTVRDYVRNFARELERDALRELRKGRKNVQPAKN